MQFIRAEKALRCTLDSEIENWLGDVANARISHFSEVIRLNRLGGLLSPGGGRKF